MSKWILYVLSLGFATYWACNLLLWYPWSYSSTLGIILMLTVAPFLWAYSTYLGLKTIHGSDYLKGAFMIAGIFLLLAVVMDYFFFAIIRGAIEELYHPTTFYGYGFLLVWPLIITLVFRRKLMDVKQTVSKYDIMKASVCGLVFLLVLVLIIYFDIKI